MIHLVGEARISLSNYLRTFHFAHYSTSAGQLTERQLLKLRPHSLTYTPDSRRKKKPNTTPKLNWARAPASVVGWQDFISKVSSLTLNDTAPRYNEPTFIRYEAAGEWDFQYALSLNVLSVLSKTIGSIQMPEEAFCRSAAHDGIQGEPEFILMAGDRLRLAMGVKTKWDLPAGDIVEMYRENLENLAARRASPVSVIDRIKEIYGYMGHNELQYGVLSTYESTWFLRRPQDHPGKLFVSEAVMNTATDPTLLQCFAYIMSLARRSPNSPFPPSTPPSKNCKTPSEQDYDASEINQADTEGSGAAGTEQSEKVLELEDFGWDGLKVISVLGYGRCGKVYKAVLRGEEVAYKLCDLWKHPEYEKELLNEAKTYMDLEKLQGRTIPKLKGIGYTAGGFMAFATEIAGSPIKAEELSDQERNEIVTALSGIHSHGILHNDISLENILIQRHCDGFKVMFIDFAFSKRVSNKGKARREMARLRWMLGIPP